jgi:hypothetical protein
MNSTIYAWDRFKTSAILKKTKVVFNAGLTNNDKKNHKDFMDKYHLPNELLEILCDSNGQNYNSDAIFLELNNGILGMNFLYYHFLSLADIIKIYGLIQSHSKGEIDINLIPFAKLEKPVEKNVLTVFAIHTIDKTIYKTQVYEWERFITHFEFRSEKFAANLNDFLENQILWYGLK